MAPQVRTNISWKARLPPFPHWKPVALSDRVVIDSYTRQYLPYSDFNFTSLWTWDTNDERLIADLYGNLAVRFTDYTTLEPFFAFLGTNDPEQTAYELIQHALASGISPVLRLMPAESVRGLQTSARFTIEEDERNFDYILSIPQLATLRGAAWKDTRYRVRRFLRAYPHARFAIVDVRDVAIQHAMLSVFDQWAQRKQRAQTPDDLQHERVAIERFFHMAELPGHVGSAVFEDQTMLGFSLDEILPHGYCMGHFWKADHAYGGIYDFLAHHIALHLETHGARWWNFEQDLGIETLKRAKLQYRPLAFLKKYTVSLVNQS